MNRPEIISALRLGHDEIIALRRRVAELEPKAHAYDTISQMVRLTIPQTPQSYGEDAAWRIKSLVEKLVDEREEQANETQ